MKDFEEKCFPLFLLKIPNTKEQKVYKNRDRKHVADQRLIGKVICSNLGCLDGKKEIGSPKSSWVVEPNTKVSRTAARPFEVINLGNLGYKLR